MVLSAARHPKYTNPSTSDPTIKPISTNRINLGTPNKLVIFDEKIAMMMMRMATKRIQFSPSVSWAAFTGLPDGETRPVILAELNRLRKNFAPNSLQSLN